MLLSVIIPAYNCEKTIMQAIKSTGVYSNNQIEVIVVNNGSQDRTEELVKKKQEVKRILFTQNQKKEYLMHEIRALRLLLQDG